MSNESILKISISSDKRSRFICSGIRFHRLHTLFQWLPVTCLCFSVSQENIYEGASSSDYLSFCRHFRSPLWAFYHTPTFRRSVGRLLSHKYLLVTIDNAALARFWNSILLSLLSASFLFKLLFTVGPNWSFWFSIVISDRLMECGFSRFSIQANCFRSTCARSYFASIICFRSRVASQTVRYFFCQVYVCGFCSVLQRVFVSVKDSGGTSCYHLQRRNEPPFKHFVCW